jgi:predicted kinase
MTEQGSPRPQLIIVSGRQGAGKTTLGRALSQALRCPLISRDELHEGIRRTLSDNPTVATRESLRDQAFYGFFQVIEFLLSRKVTLVAEAAFRDRIWRRELDPALAMADTRVIQCELDPELARERVVQRRLANSKAIDLSRADAAPPTLYEFEPLSLPLPTLRVDTSGSYDPPFEQVVAFAAARSPPNK